MPEDIYVYHSYFLSTNVLFITDGWNMKRKMLIKNIKCLEGEKHIIFSLILSFLNNPLSLYHLETTWAPTPEREIWDLLPVPPSIPWVFFLPCAGLWEKSSQCEYVAGMRTSRPGEVAWAALASGRVAVQSWICPASTSEFSAPSNITHPLDFSYSLGHFLAPQWNKWNVYSPRVLRYILSIPTHLPISHLSVWPFSKAVPSVSLFLVLGGEM